MEPSYGLASRTEQTHRKLFTDETSAVYTASMRTWNHQTIDRANADADRLIARRLRRDPRLLQRARRNLKCWMAREGKHVAPVFLEWAGLLDILTRSELADFLDHGTALARRLRQSTPFMGLLTKRGRRRIERV